MYLLLYTCTVKILAQANTFHLDTPPSERPRIYFLFKIIPILPRVILLKLISDLTHYLPIIHRIKTQTP